MTLQYCILLFDILNNNRRSIANGADLAISPNLNILQVSNDVRYATEVIVAGYYGYMQLLFLFHNNTII
jgi:hypothetical protein